MDFETKSPLPYPEINIDTVSPYEVKLLIPAYGGRDSETTAIMTYMYQHYVLKPNKMDMAAALEDIAIAEMTHHDMLGTMIVLLGGTPIISGNYNYWQGGYVNYAKNPNTILNHNIIIERKAIEDYKQIIMKSNNETVKAVVARIILDEEIHIKAFEYMRNLLMQD